MMTNPWRRLMAACWIGAILFGSASPASAAARAQPAPVKVGDNTYSLTRSARFAFSMDTDKLKEVARADAAKFCAGMGKRMKEVSISAQKASILWGGFSEATVIFKALDPADPELAEAPGAPAASSGAGDLAALVDLHEKKLLSDAEFDAARERLVARSGDLDRLLELKRKGILTDAEFEAAKSRLMERTK